MRAGKGRASPCFPCLQSQPVVVHRQGFLPALEFPPIRDFLHVEGPRPDDPVSVVLRGPAFLFLGGSYHDQADQDDDTNKDW